MVDYGPFTKEELIDIARLERGKWLDKSYDYWISLYDSEKQTITYWIEAKEADLLVEIELFDMRPHEVDPLDVRLTVTVKTKRSRFFGDTWRGVGKSWLVYRDGRVET